MANPTSSQLTHDHTAHHHHAHEAQTRWVVAVAAVTMVAEIVVGSISGSMALTADGWHMATHVGALGISALAYWFARTRSSSKKFPFGTGKVYALAGYTSAMFLGAVALWMLIESGERIVHPTIVHCDNEAIAVAVFGLLVNLVSAKILEHDDEHHDANIKAAYMHVLADAVTSVLAIASLVCGRLFGWTFLDPIMGALGSFVILHWGFRLIGDTARPLLDATGCEISEKRVRDLLESIDDVKIVDMHLWEMSPGKRGCIVSITTSTPKEACVYRDKILSEIDIAHLTVEIHTCE